MATNINLLKEKNLNIEDLLLDPNNPRFSKHLDEITPANKFADKEVQALTYKLMNDPKNHFEIGELVNAIMSDGFIPVDKIFVKKAGTKYLVIEGNRRITAINKILKEHKDDLDPEIKKQIVKIPCIVIDSEGPEADDMVRKILGLRHHGSILPWRPLPAAFNLYQEYMSELCSKDSEKVKDPDNFIYQPAIAKKVAATFSVKWGDVKDQVRLYRVYLQLDKASSRHPDVIGPNSFSMIDETLQRDDLKKFFGYNETASTFSEDGVEKILDLYFGLRGKGAVINQASAGPSNVRDFAYVISEGTEEDVRRITVDREKSGGVRAEVETKRSERNLKNSLDIILNELNKIPFGVIDDNGLAPNEITVIESIDKKMNKLKRAAGL